ncbi:4Fe-4S dicluster domain-containing protein [Carboxydocella sporoproducens DSM 16521]|uniref:Ferredoxin n=2 Tax=Carboxydocella TaxID=178898 RepID=A0A1T4MKN4_9FIRM|nr:MULTISPECIES: 2Fe-2S iron-sulfur cluster-binding protein [Carboxydocella]AVX21360.1 4Fe-4S dicluster domain-containing protein [Carboxydocella thermautotrophica]AVX31858.1 4Fe-4S dicluster domain-containing protein [Carboxydocella thermautotrophica]GAW28540.1 NADH:ubiquinone oxidoreductase subunit G, iron-sulfur binding protein [Carboxydocella sp. ULO1]SJZ67324.1 4Fe-4S dicluster domain-containing protein [Carboxydocella sporoproducens DSM 16521]
MNKVTLTINGQKVTVPAEYTVLEAARELGINIPTLCYDPRLSKPGACRLCVVEVKGARNLPASCVTPVAEGMEVETHSPAVMEARKTILELLLANHPNDCLTCEASGACLLQQYAYEYGVRDPGFGGERHAYPLDDSNPYIQRDLNKCILCGKCVRICAEIRGQHAIHFAYRGFSTKIAPALDTDLAFSNCIYCNNCVSVCPVGALVDKRTAGLGRTWELEREEKTCTFCEAGCQFFLLKKQGQVVGVAAGQAAPGRPLCLKGRLGMDLRYNPKAQPPYLRNEDGSFRLAPWAEALGLTEILANLQKEGGER